MTVRYLVWMEDSKSVGSWEYKTQQDAYKQYIHNQNLYPHLKHYVTAIAS